MNLRHSILAVALALGLPAVALAQAAEPVASLQVESGSIQVSGPDGQFVPAQSGVQLAPGNRVLVPSGASATVAYPGGCNVTLNTPGVHTILAACTPAPINTASGATGTVGAGGAVGIVATTVALTAAGMDEGLGESDDERPPISR